MAAGIIAATLAVAATAMILLWRDRPELLSGEWEAPVPAAAAAADSVTVTWLGVTTLLFDDGETQILIDGFFSRPSLADILLDRPVVNDAATINYALNEYGMRRLAAIIPTHSHFDHAMDVGSIANRSSASILGSASTIAIARGAGVPEDQITLVSDGERYTFGRFDITLLPSTHAPIGWRAAVPFAGRIEAPLKMPQPVSAFREGGSYTIVVGHPEGTAVVQGSAGFPDKALADVPADVVLLGVGGLETLGRDYITRYWQTLVTATGAHTVYPLHFDDFTRPFGEIVAAPRFLGDLEATARLFTDLRDRWDTNTRLVLPAFGVPMAIYVQPGPDT
ncbi:MAG: MBL fold metallo-hydrolase [Woeseiaceae bacterium]|nr:MBL fold metallo-hydrolase [Woeseiaceae bacterium]